MLPSEKLFGNYFNDERIINVRLANFAADCLNRLTQNNNAGVNTPLISLLTPALTALQQELGEVASSLGTQKSRTLTVNNVIEDFRDTMSELEGVIAHSLGGSGTAAYLEFYPQGITEYTRSTKPEIPVLLKRVKTAATKHAATLGTTITAELQSFDVLYASVRDDQQQTKGSVDENRSDRTTARKNVEEVLLRIIHTIAERHPGKVQQCMAYFDFSLLVGRRDAEAKESPDAA